MKKSILIFASFLALSSLYGQKSIDALFNKYSGKNGFVSLTFSGNFFSLASCIDPYHDEPSSIPPNVTQIRILAPEGKSSSQENFYDMVIDEIDLHEYEEFMSVKESDQDLVMLVRSEGKAFREFLLIAGGDDNALVQVKGKMTFSEAKKFSKDFKKNKGLYIDLDTK